MGGVGILKTELFSLIAVTRSCWEFSVSSQTFFSPSFSQKLAHIFMTVFKCDKEEQVEIITFASWTPHIPAQHPQL